MVTVESKIRKIVEGMGISYVFNDWSRANVELDDISYPVVINILPVSGYLNLKFNQFKDRPNCLIAFADLTEFDFESTENDNILEKCKRRAMEFFTRVNRSGLFEQIENDLPYSVFYDKLDANITGIMFEVNLKEIQGILICPDDDFSKLYE